MSEKVINKISPKRVGLVALAGITFILFILTIAVNTIDSSLFKVFSRADTVSELRLWFDPAQIRVNSNQSLDVAIYAEFNGQNKLLPQLNLHLNSLPGVNIEPVDISYNQPFTGRTLIKTVKVTPKTSGKFTLSINEELVRSYVKDANIFTSPAIITVK